MPVTGATTATLAPPGVYQAPFQAYTPDLQVPIITGVPKVAPTGNPNPIITPSATGAAAYADAYLQSHMTSLPSYRYAYLFWMAMAVIAIVYALGHQLKISGGSLGASFSKWGMRRVTIGPKTHRRSRALPSNGALVVSVVVVAVAIALCLVGNDFINPSAGVFQFSVARRWDLSSIPQYTITKSLWTMANRFGYMSFAVLPLVILLAAKSRPIALLSFRYFTAVQYDKLLTFHQLAGWLVWGLTTAHVALWTVQLFKDSYNGKAMWFHAFTAYRFIVGCIAYGILTLLMVSTLRPVRRYRFEAFYMSHVTLTFLLLVASALHHPAIWWWIAAAFGIWAVDRITRAIRYARINSGASKTARARGYQSTGTEDIALEEFTDKMLPHVPHDAGAQSSPQLKPSPQLGYGEFEIQPTGTWEATFSDPYDPQPQARTRLPGTNLQRVTSAQTYNTAATLQELPKPPPIPAGYAQAQLLPSRTIRLTIKTPHHIKWEAGQHLMLTLPEISKFQSHPFTITNTDQNQNEMVILIKARKGLTRQLYNFVRQRSERSLMMSDKQGSTVPKAVPVYLRAKVDAPYGSAGRVRWRDYSTVLIVCGGSGVSFGLAICDFVTRAMQQGDFKTNTRRLRFVWVAREYAEIAWAASALCRAQKMAQPAQLRIDIYVTNANPNARSSAYDDFQPPRPLFPGMRRSISSSSIYSAMSQDDGTDYDDIDDEMQAAATTLLELTNYDSDDEDMEDPAEAELSRQMQKHGKMRRAKTRKQMRQAQQGHRPDEPASYPPPSSLPAPGMRSSSRGASGASTPRLPSGVGTPNPFSHAQRDSVAPSIMTQNSGVMGYPQSLYDDSQGLLNGDTSRRTSGQYHARRTSGGTEPRNSGDQRFSGDRTRDTRMSYASSMYDQYDPYSGGVRTGISPAPSMIFDDADTTRYAMSVLSRTQSMVLLEDAAPLRPGDGMSGSPVGLWIDEADYAAMTILSEQARAGRPKLSKIMDEELEYAEGSMIVATCGPEKLNTVVRNLVSRNIKPGKILHGDKRGHVTVYSEDFES